MSGIQPPQPTQSPIEYTRGTGAFQPQMSSAAAIVGEITAGEATAGSDVTVTPGSSPGDSVVNVQVAALVAAAFPAAPIDGQLVYRTDLGHLYVFIEAANAWHTA